MTEWQDTLAALSAPFSVAEVKQRQGGGKMLDYIDWTAVVRRLNDVCPDWSMDSKVHSIHNVQVTKSGKQVPGFAVVCEVTLTVPNNEYGDVYRCGVGAGVSDDIDMAAKTAQAEALKKASNQFGMALELWDADHRNSLKAVRDAIKNQDVATLKKYLASSIPDFTGDRDTLAAKFKAHYNLPDDADTNNFEVLEALVNV
jgi:hypothetical protein